MELLSADKEKASELGKLLTTPNPISAHRPPYGHCTLQWLLQLLLRSQPASAPLLLDLLWSAVLPSPELLPLLQLPVDQGDWETLLLRELDSAETCCRIMRLH
jgi:hypothetical protein